MRLLLTSDWHTRFLAPENRTEANFFDDVVLAKIKAVAEIAESHEVDAIVQAGDMFDNPDPSRYVLAKMIKLLKSYNIPIYTVLGQHDTAYRQLNDISRTASFLLESAGVIQIVGLDKRSVSLSEEDHFIHGLSFEQEHSPKPVKDCFNLLVAHATVGEKPLFPGHELKTARAFIKEHKGFDVILLGDIHQEFKDSFLDTDVFNTGPLIRKTLGEKLEKPNVIIFDTKTKKHERIEIKHRSWTECFNLVEEKKIDDTKLQEFIKAIKDQKKLSVSFDDNLREYFKMNPVNDSVRDIIGKAMAKVGMSIKELKEITN